MAREFFLDWEHRGKTVETPTNETLDIERHEMKKPEMAVEKRERKNTDGERWIGGERLCGIAGE